MAGHLKIETVAFDLMAKKFFKSQLTVDTGSWKSESLEKIPVDVQFTELEGTHDSYYKVTISDFYGPEVTGKDKHKRIHAKLQEANIGPALFATYPDQIFQRQVVFAINGREINPDDYIVGEIESRQEIFTTLDGVEYPMTYQFMQVKSVGKHRVSLRVANESIRTVAHTFDYIFETPDAKQWFVFVDSTHFDESANTFRNLDIYQLDPGADHLVNEIKGHVDTFFAKKYEQYQEFVQKLKADSHYPYRNHHASSETRSMVFNQLAFYLEEQHRLLNGKETIRELVYSLLDKVMDNRELEAILTETIKLDPESLRRFKSLLDRAKLSDVIAFSEEVCRKQQFLDFLHKLNYDEISQKVKERSELHKIVEKHLWLFGEQYNGTPTLFSDTNLSNNLTKLRGELFAYEPSVSFDNIQEVSDEKVKNITDLFFFNEHMFSEEDHEIMIVELKAPRVKLSLKELNQAMTYAHQIEGRGVFPKSLRYKVLLISAALNPIAKGACGRDSNPYLYHVSPSKKVEIWVMEWSDLIHRNKKKLNYLGNALHTKDKDAKAMIETEFKDANLSRLKSQLGATATKPKKQKSTKRTNSEELATK
jgi:hypothetical protein